MKVGSRRVWLVRGAVALYFPDGTLPSPRWRPRVVLGSLAVLVLTAMVAPAPIDASAAVQNPLGLPLPAWAAPLLAAPALICIFGLTSISLVALVLRLRRATGRERARLAWLSLAALVAVSARWAGGPPTPDRGASVRTRMPTSLRGWPARTRRSSQPRCATLMR